MKQYDIVSGGRGAKTCAVLTYDEASDIYAVTIAPWADEADVPALFAPFLGTGIVPDKWARRWVLDRVVPAERQNIGEVLRNGGLDTYDAIVLLEQTEGRSASDDFLVIPSSKTPVQEHDYEREVGETVRQARQTAHLSQEELAERTGFSQPFISLLERGRANPTVGTLATIAQGLGMELTVGFE